MPTAWPNGWKWAIDLAISRGVQIQSGSRVVNALKLVERLARANVTGDLNGTDTALEAAIEHHRTAAELFVIMLAASVCQHEDHPFTNEKLETVFGGPDLVEGRDRSARNIEFELAVAARLVLGGILVFAGEPDLRFQFGGELMGVAVKRVSSLNDNQIKTAIKRGVHQIKESRLRGHLALRLESRLNEIAATPGGSEFLSGVDQAYRVIEDFRQYFEKDRAVAGVMINSHVTHPKGDPARNGRPQLDTNQPWRFLRFFEEWDLPDGPTFWNRWLQTLTVNMQYAYGNWRPDQT